MVYYRKYRPQNLEELIGQEAVKQVLTGASQSGKLSHAYLFSGPKGTGKTSTARILAKIVNCENQIADKTNSDDRRLTTEDIPCNKCASCLSITNGSNLDFIEIDAASNRGIDDIRTLRENIKLAPSASGKKVYVIDEVHMLTTEAFNALLKTLEEPPEHVLFILATTEPQKIPATILSRVQRLDFQQATAEQLVLALEKIVKSEKLELEDGVLKLIAKRAEGSFRDAEKILDQLASKDKKISLKDLEQQINSGSNQDVLELLQSLAQKDSATGLKIVAKQVENGVNLKEFIQDLLESLRQIIFTHHQTAADKEFQTLAGTISLSEAIRLINLFHQALEQMKITSIPSLPLEVAVVESCQNQMRSDKQSLPSDEGEIRESENTEVLIHRTTNLSEKPIISEKTKEMLEEAKLETEIPAITASSDELTKLLDKWTYILETIKPYNFSLEALLRQVKVLSSDEGMVVLEVPYSFHQRILEAPKSRDLLESVISDVLGKPGRVSCVLGARPVRVEEIANIEIAADDEIISVAAAIFNSEPIN